MIEDFKGLEEEEINLMFNVPILVTVLIAGADNTIDKKELDRAISLSRLKQNTSRKALTDYFNVVAESFETNLLDQLKKYPKSAEERNPLIIAELEKVNSILLKLDRLFAIQFYASMKDLAKNIAEASGGVLGYLAVGYDEWKLIGLDMIKNPEG